MPDNLAFSTIGAVERATGIAKTTLRVWERRYAFPAPQRDLNGDRIYPRDQVQRLALVKRLLDQGFRPGKLMRLNPDELAQLASKSNAEPAAAPATAGQLAEFLELLKAHRIPELRQRLWHAIRQDGLRSFVTDIAAPLTRMVGDAWAGGALAVFEEHLYAAALQAVLHHALQAAPRREDGMHGSPRVLLTTVPLERHGLGLLMAEALLVLEGAHCIALGVQTPLSEIVAAARAQRVDVVALSFSAAASTRATVENLAELRRRLGDATGIWAGGAAAMRVRRYVTTARVMDLDDIAEAVADWRARHPAGG